MPTALENLVKILKLEREKGCEDNAVIGGLTAYGVNWENQALEQARRAEQVVLAEEIAVILQRYSGLKDKAERLSQINYMLGRILGRIPMPTSYAERLAVLQQAFGRPSEAPPEARPVPSPKETAPSKAERKQRSRSESESERRERARLERPRTDQAQSEQRPSPKRTEGKQRPKSGEQRSKPDERRSARLGADEDDEAPDNLRGLSDASERYLRDDDFYLRPVRGSGQLDVKPLPRLARPPRQRRPHLSIDEARARLHELERPITSIRGIGEKTAPLYHNLGLHTLRDLLDYLPRRYDDYTRLNTIARLRLGETETIIARVTRTETRRISGRQDFIVWADDGTGRIMLTFFGQPFLSRVILTNKQYVFSGKVTMFRDKFQMNNAEWEALDAENLHAIGIVPIYGLTEGLKPRSFRKTMKAIVDEWADKIPDYVPRSILDRAELADLGWAIRQIHFPQGFDHLAHAQRRYMFDQLFLMQLAILGNRREWQGVPANPLPVSDEWLDTFVQKVFPYPLTGDQQRAIADIRQDIAKAIPMNRLIQGDVGAGKTAVALVALAMAIANGKQAALMAPTSILAEQHYRNLSKLLANWPTERSPVIALMTSALSSSERESIYRGLASGSVDLAIGTHALIQEGVEFADLGLVVVDEQHRFGVGQRAALRGKGTNPHLLVMTATPIPRTLALTIYADLDLTVIREKPAGRQPVKTRIILPVERERAFSFIEGQLAQGRQAFIVHPLVEASDKVDTRSAVEAYEQLRQVFHRYRVCLLHGKMRPSEKDEVMGAFARHEYDVMVTTSVAEVGVDVPNATVMLIEGANRFGLSQLHQFRGRVGRGEYPSSCILIPDEGVFTRETLTPSGDENPVLTDAQLRLKAMEETDDGFRLAELDWKLRGAGDLLGTRQSGQHLLQLAERMTPELVELAQREARTLYIEDPALVHEEHQLLAERVHMLVQQAADVS
ncbi:MAG: ATP-dependent DNA helicase RecG [Anaerolineae bacterium]|nr:ATP-dependent DNA helicase RecG [Anaerolineae bacterium]MDW8172448.1 ATP-dependent DNA helicase RecG [Anaerolineae bacterium]